MLGIIVRIYNAVCPSLQNIHYRHYWDGVRINSHSLPLESPKHPIQTKYPDTLFRLGRPLSVVSRSVCIFSCEHDSDTVLSECFQCRRTHVQNPEPSTLCRKALNRKQPKEYTTRAYSSGISEQVRLSYKPTSPKPHIQLFK